MMSPQHQLIEHPNRRDLLDLLSKRLVPLVRKAKQRDELAARRPLGIDPVEMMMEFAEWGQTAPLVELSALVQWYAWSWMTLDQEFREWMLCGLHNQWWGVVVNMVKAWQSKKLVDWPVYPLHPIAQQYKPSDCTVVSLVELLSQLFLLWL